MLFAVDIMPDNIEELQHRLGYLVDGKPNIALLDKNNFLSPEDSKHTPDHYIIHRVLNISISITEI